MTPEVCGADMGHGILRLARVVTGTAFPAVEICIDVTGDRPGSTGGAVEVPDSGAVPVIVRERATVELEGVGHAIEGQNRPVLDVGRSGLDERTGSPVELAAPRPFDELVERDALLLVRVGRDADVDGGRGPHATVEVDDREVVLGQLVGRTGADVVAADLEVDDIAGHAEQDVLAAAEVVDRGVDTGSVGGHLDRERTHLVDGVHTVVGAVRVVDVGAVTVVTVGVLAGAPGEQGDEDRRGQVAHDVLQGGMGAVNELLSTLTLAKYWPIVNRAIHYPQTLFKRLNSVFLLRLGKLICAVQTHQQNFAKTGQKCVDRARHARYIGIRTFVTGIPTNAAMYVIMRTHRADARDASTRQSGFIQLRMFPKGSGSILRLPKNHAAPPLPEPRRSLPCLFRGIKFLTPTSAEIVRVDISAPSQVRVTCLQRICFVRATRSC